VEIFTSGLGPRFNRIIDVIADSLMLAFALLVASRHFLGMLDKRAYGETTLLLQFPIWWAYAAGMIGAAVFVIVALYCFIRSWSALLTDGTNVSVAETDRDQS
jgi:TRAP-type C4-dicarboxylate transport system permease small subunit